MPRISTDRIKFNKPLGVLPALQFLLPEQLNIDESYQRSIDTDDSQRLIRKIAQDWNWDLCQPLVVARRENGALYVIDGQHRLAAARLRGDIAQLPAVVVNYASAADEAASFVHLNQQRRPLNALQVFNAAVVSGDSEACAIVEALAAADLALAKTTNSPSWKPGMVGNVGGLMAAWRKFGPKVTGEALQVLSTAFAGEVLLYAGTIFPGIVAVVATETGVGKREMDPARFTRLCNMLARSGQVHWRRAALREKVDNAAGLGTCMAVVLKKAWAKQGEFVAKPVPAALPIAPSENRAAIKISQPEARAAGAFTLEAGKAWCGQCEQRRSAIEAQACQSQFCKLKGLKAA